MISPAQLCPFISNPAWIRKGPLGFFVRMKHGDIHMVNTWCKACPSLAHKVHSLLGILPSPASTLMTWHHPSPLRTCESRPSSYYVHTVNNCRDRSVPRAFPSSTGWPSTAGCSLVSESPYIGHWLGVGPRCWCHLPQSPWGLTPALPVVWDLLCLSLLWLSQQITKNLVAQTTEIYSLRVLESKSGLLPVILDARWFAVAKLQSLLLLHVSQMSLSFSLGRTAAIGPKSRMISPQGG